MSANPNAESENVADLDQERGKHRGPAGKTMDEAARAKEAELRAAAGTDDDKLAERLIGLAKLPKNDYALKRRAEADALGMRVSDLDAAVIALRKIEQGVADERGQRDELVEIAHEHATFWTDAAGTAYATLSENGGLATFRVRSEDFRRRLVAWFGDRHKRTLPDGREVAAAPGGQALSEAITALDAHATRGETRPAFTRIAHHGGKVYLDLGDAAWTVIEIDADGWRVAPQPPVRFVRSPGLLPLPEPEKGGTAKGLENALGLSGAAAKLAIGWLLGGFSNGPYPVLFVNGEHGSGKSTLVLRLRALIDPNQAPARAKPKTEDDLLIAAQAGHVVALDNLSGIDAAFSDAMCRVSTGAGWSKRKLFTDSDEVLIQVRKPQVANGIADLANAPDLLDRAVQVELPARADGDREDEAELDRRFEAARPKLLGVLLDAVSAALRNREATVIPDGKKPRMLDFARWVEAAAPAFGWPKHAFLDLYNANRKEAAALSLESDAFAAAVRDHGAVIAGTGKGWAGTATALLDRINAEAGEEARKTAGWPKTGIKASGKLRRFAPALKAAGLDVTFERGRDTRTVRLALNRNHSSQSSPNVTDAPRGDKRDECDDRNPLRASRAEGMPTAPLASQPGEWLEEEL